MRETFGAFEIGVMPASTAAPAEPRVAEPEASRWAYVFAVMLQVFACLGESR